MIDRSDHETERDDQDRAISAEETGPETGSPDAGTSDHADDLPPENTTRWVVRRKAQVVRAIDTGLIDEDEACRRYNLTMEELQSWRSLIDQHGLRGLRATKVQEYRDTKRPAKRRR